jgi:hypothetical protein
MTIARTPIPELSDVDVVFGCVDHLPARDDLPEEFRLRWDRQQPHCEFISQWFFKGRTPDDMARLTPKKGIDREKALRAIKAILASWAPQHEHKIGGCGFLLSEWFDVATENRS